MRLATLSALWALSAGATLGACAGAVVPESPRPEQREALLVLPGFGYSHGATAMFRALRAALTEDGIDLFVPNYVERGGLDESRAELRGFIRDNHLERYARVHVFAYIAGAWTLNPLLDSAAMPNVVTIVYDRSPMQERAPRVAYDKLHFLTWLRYGQPVFDMARRRYPALATGSPRVGIVVETRPTSLIKRYSKTALSYGPLRFECDQFDQRFDDCIYVSLSHDELYTRFGDVLPDVLAFIKAGRFTDAATRAAPTVSPLP